MKKIIFSLRIVKENEMPTTNKNNTNGKSFPSGSGTSQKHLQALFVIPNNKIEKEESKHQLNWQKTFVFQE